MNMNKGVLYNTAGRSEVAEKPSQNTFQSREAGKVIAKVHPPYTGAMVLRYTFSV